MFESGAVICFGIVIWWARCGWKTRMWILSHSLFIDIAVFISLMLLHWGTFSGGMSATVGALMVSVMLTIGRKAFGYNEHGKYVRGMWDMSERLK